MYIIFDHESNFLNKGLLKLLFRQKVNFNFSIQEIINYKN